MTEETNNPLNLKQPDAENNVIENKKKHTQSKENESKQDVDDCNGNDREQQPKVILSSNCSNNIDKDLYEPQIPHAPQLQQSIEAIKKEDVEPGDTVVKQDKDPQNEDQRNEEQPNEDQSNQKQPNEQQVQNEQPNEDQHIESIELQIQIEEEEDAEICPTSPRTTAMKEEWATKRRFDGNGLPLVVCLRCNNHFFVEKTEQHFTATARHKNLKYAFSLIPDQIETDIYQLIHIQSGCYLGVKKMGKDWVLSPVNNDDDKFAIINRKDLCFNIIRISNEKEVNLKVSIGWNNKLLTISDEIDEINDEEANAKQILVFEPEKTENAQVFTLERVTDDVEEDDLDILFLLDLVDQPRMSKIGINLIKLKRYKHISSELNELIQQIYVRIDINKTGYAIYNQVWSQFVQYSQGMLPNVVKKVFEDGINNNYDPALLGDLANKLIHIKNFICCIDTICEFYENEIKMEGLQNKKEAASKALDPIDIKLRRLDSDILKEHPFLEQWQNMSSFRRKLYDWKIYVFDKWNSSGQADAGFFLWRKHLLSIQSTYGESIFAFFQFTRWLMILNCIMALFYGCLMFTHCLDFNFTSFAYDEYIDMALGNEFIDSWWFYGAYKSEYVGWEYLSYNVAFVWIVVSVCSAGISVIAILRVLLTSGIYFGDDEYIFSKNVFANYNHSLSHADAVTLQRNSLMIRLHETLLNKLDDEENKLTFMLVLKRIIGIILCLIIGLLSGIGIVLLLHFEKSYIIPYVSKRYPLIESIAPYIVPAGVSVIKGMTPHIVRGIVLFESYSAEFLFQQTFFRVFILRIFAILVTLFQTAQTAEFTENDDGAACAESQIGMVLYKFILFDMVIEIIFYFVVPEIKYCCGRCCGSIRKLTKEEELSELNRKSHVNVLENKSKKKKKNQHKTEFELAGDSWKRQFDIPGALVDVMYRQGIVWSGMYFSPMIPVIAVIASMTTFFVKKRYLFRYCGRPKKALGVTKQLKFFYGMMLLAILTSFVPFNYFLNRTPNCGPHKNQNVLNQTETTLDQDMPYFLRTFFYYAFNGLLLLPLFMFSLVYLGYVRGVKNVHHANSRILKERLLKEKDEKKQILKDYNIRL